jgi:type IV pilus assembly protein PilQ
MFHSMVTGTSPSTAMARPMQTLRWLLAGLLLLALTPALALANTLESINSTPLPDNKLEVVLGFSAPPSTPLGFTIENPAKIALDFTGTKLGLSKRSYDIGVGAVSSVTAAEAGGRTRLVFNLTNSVPYKTRIDGNKLIVTLSTATVAQIANSGNNTAHFGKTSSTATVRNSSISNIQFHRGKDGGGLITLTLGDPNQAIDLTQRAGKIIVNAYNASIPQKLQRRMIVSDFGTPVSSIDARQNGSNVQLVINASGDYEQLAYQADNKFTVDIKPQAQTTAGGAPSKPKYTGQRISLNFQNIAVRSVLQLLADFTGLNIVVSDAVTGNVTLRLKNVPWDQAMAIILQSKGLAERRTGNVIMIAPAKTIEAQEQQQIQAQQAMQKLAPLHTQIFQIRYTKADALASLLKSIQTSLSGNGGNAQQTSSGVSGLSSRGSVVADARTNSLIVRDTNQGLANVAQLIQRLDVPVKQVLIGSRLVYAKKSFSRDLGVKFGVTAPGQQAGGQGGYKGFGIGGSPNGQLFNVNLPAASPTSGFGLSLAKLSSTFNLSLEISAAEQEGTVRQLSNPRVITANDKAAMIQQGVQIPYQEASSSGATSTSFKTAALKLQVTPHITPNDRILMDLDVSNDSVGGIFNGVPSINTQEVKTQVMVDNGQTVVLGGIYQEDKEHTVNKVPFFGDLPVLGNLFRNNVNSKTRNELLIFITPKIINNNLSLTQ